MLDSSGTSSESILFILQFLSGIYLRNCRAPSPKLQNFTILVEAPIEIMANAPLKIPVFSKQL